MSDPQVSDDREVGEIAGQVCFAEYVGGCFYPDCKCPPRLEEKTVEAPVLTGHDCTLCKAQGAVVFCFTPGCPLPKLKELSKGTQPLLGTIWKHYRGQEYRVLGACIIEATLEPGVIYRRADYDLGTIWVRSVADWHARVSEHIPHRFVQVVA